MDSSDESDGSNLTDPIIIVIDNAHLMDATSWKLFGDLSFDEYKVAFFLVVKYDYRDRLLIRPATKEAFDEAWRIITDQNGIEIGMREMPSLNEQSVRELI